MRRRTLHDCAVSSACRKGILNADSSDGVDGAQPDDATAMRTSMAQIRHDYNAAPRTHPRERILFSMVRDSNKLPRINSEFQSRSAKIRSPMGMVERLACRRVAGVPAGGVRAGLAASYLIANDAMIAPAESAITSQNK